MRLTDRPRSLAEMKPEVKWPAQLQAVMDRALSRDAAGRYASAAEFGHDFAKAIERMPQTVAIEAGTSIINTPSVPQTAIAPAPAMIAATGANTSVQPARRTSRAPIVIGGAAVAVAAAIAFVMMKDGADEHRGRADSLSSRPATVVPNGASPADTTRSGGAAAGRTPPPPTTTARALDRRGAPAAGEAGLSPVEAKAEIDSIGALAHGEGTAAEALRRVSAILPKLRSGDDSAQVLLYESDAYLAGDDSARTCNALKKIGRRGNSIVRQSVVSGLSNC